MEASRGHLGEREQQGVHLAILKERPEKGRCLVDIQSVLCTCRKTSAADPPQCI